MRINTDNQSSFQSLRKDRAFVRQLAVENGYSLAENNQKNILKAIKSLSESATISSTKFLIETAKNLKYSTNIPFNISPKNKWKAVLMLAASACAVKAGIGASKSLNKEYKEAFYNMELSDEERSILTSYDDILAKMNGFGPDKKEYEAAKNNLEYFIMSSETSIGDKKYILERLNYFLSDDYKINPQLEDKKFQAFSEIINDLALDKVNSDVPNIKASNQNTHGMCTVFSITRKLLAYEYKRNYTDFILQELDDSDTMMIYDRRDLGKGKKVPVKKAVIDYDGMLARGFRIIDAAAANWMNIADADSATSNVETVYVPYDSGAFGVYDDAHLKIVNPDTKISGEHNYITALTVTEDKLKNVKSAVIKQKLYTDKNRLDNKFKAAEYSRSLQESLSNIFKGLLAEDYKDMTHDMTVGVLGLQKENSKAIKSTETVAPEYLYIDNEETSVKQNKIKSYLNDRYGFAFNQSVDDKTAEKVYELTEEIRAVQSPAPISLYRMAKMLTGAASAFRNQMMISCTLPERLHNYQISLGIPDEDTVFLNNISALKEKVEADNEFIINSLSKNLEIEPSKEGVLEFLNSSEEYIRQLPEIYDDLYKRLNKGDRKTVLINELKASLQVLDSDNQEAKRNLMSVTGIYGEDILRSRVNEALDLLTYRDIINTYAEVLECEPEQDTVIAKIREVLTEFFGGQGEEKMAQIADGLGIAPEEVMDTLVAAGGTLTGAFDEVYYAQASELINQKSIKNDFLKYYGNLVTTLSGGVSVEFITNLLINNGLPVEITTENLSALPGIILGAINDMADTVNTIAQKLYIERDGDIVNSVFTPHIVLDYYEKAYLLQKASVIDKFNRKFEALDKLYANKHKYSDRAYKVRRKELTKFTKSQREELNKMLSSVNLMYKITRQEKDMMFRSVRPDYEEIFREYGVNNGRYWTGFGVAWGLPSDKEAALLEAVTDKSYFIQNNLRKAFKDIKEGKFSGVTGSSVSDTRLGMHAQYIASIDTVKVPSKSDPEKMVEKDVLFHDNSWGRIEKENVWVDSKGLMRTDYNNDYGYKYGYITNDDYRNGTFVDDLLYKGGQVVGQKYNNKQLNKLNPSESYSFELMNDVIIPGRSPKAISLARVIKDELLIPDEYNLGVLEEYAEKMTPEQLKHKLKVLNDIEMNYVKEYNRLEKRILGDKFNKGIVTEADYNALSDDDSLKILLERAALRKMFSDSIYKEEIDCIASLKELNKLKAKMQKEVKDNFGYSFMKDSSVFGILKPALADDTEAMLKENNIEYKDVSVPELMNSALQSVKDNYDGSLRSAAKVISNNFTDEFIEKTGDLVSVELSQELREKIYIHIINKFTLKADEIDTNVLPENVINWIDKTYNPETDEEFVSIFNRLQNYTFDEYNRHVLSNLKDEDIVKNITGYDIVRSIRANREAAEDALFNEVFIDELTKNFDLSTTEPYTRYGRFSKKITGATYKKRKFDDTYMNLRYSLRKLMYEKMFAKNKEMAYKQYNALPAFPRIDLSEANADLMEKSVNLIKDAHDRLSMYREQVQLFDTADRIVEFIRGHADKALTYNEIYRLKQDVQKFIQMAAENKEFNDVSASLAGILTPDEEIDIKVYLPVADKLEKLCGALLKLCSREEYRSKIDSAEKDFSASIDVFLKLRVQPEHRDRVRGKMNEWLGALNHKKPETEDKYNELLDMVDRYYLVNTPDKLLDEYLYRLSCGVTKENEYYVNALGNTVDALLKSAKYISLQDIMMRATREGIINVVANEFDNVDLELMHIGKNRKKETAVYKMSSPEALITMLRPLLMEDNFEAARNFVQKFNLVEKVVPALLKTLEMAVVDKMLKKLQRMQKSAVSEAAIVKELKEKINALPADTKPAEIKDICRRFVQELEGKKVIKNNVFISDLIETFKNVIKSDIVDNLDGLSVQVFLNSVVQSALASSSKTLMNNVTQLNAYFYNAQIIMSFIEELTLPENNKELISEVAAARAWYEKTIEAQNAYVHALNDIDIV